MIDVSGKANTLRYARAEGNLLARPETLRRVQDGQVPKGDVLATARAAGIAAAKRTSEWIVFCHPMPLDWIEVSLEVCAEELRVTAEVRSVWKTGVEMEALAGVTGALLNAYDMLKPLDVDMTLSGIRVVEKRGGKSQYREQLARPLKTAVLVISDAKLAGTRQDKSGRIIKEYLSTQPVSLDAFEALPDDEATIRQRLQVLAAEEGFDLILTSGGTGFDRGDVTPEATAGVLERQAPGVVDMMRKFGLDRTPYAMLSREVAGTIGTTLVINLPGSSSGARESLHALFPGILHIFPMLWGGAKDKP
jgi:molybdenum cofactor biosynthesis protein MoaC